MVFSQICLRTLQLLSAPLHHSATHSVSCLKSPSSPIYIRMAIYFGVCSFVRMWSSYQWHQTLLSPSHHPLPAPAQLGVRFAPTSPPHAGILSALNFHRCQSGCLNYWEFICSDALTCAVCAQTDPLYSCITSGSYILSYPSALGGWCVT